MSAPISKKATGAAAGVAGAGSVGIALVELLGQLPVLHGANPSLVKALGGLIVLIISAYGASAGAWLVKESDDFLDYAAKESGKVLADAQHAGVIPATVDVSALESKVDRVLEAVQSKAQADAERLLSQYLSSTGAVSTGTLPEAPAAPTPEPVIPEPVAVPAEPADPVLTDDTPPAVETDPVLAD